MRIDSIRLRNFKRFTDLVVKEIPPTAKLVVVVGPNGCGKSSLFDALNHWYRMHTRFGHGGDMKYLRKDPAAAFDWGDTVVVRTHGNATPQRGSLYLRTAYRNDPDFGISSFGIPDNPIEQLRIERSIQNDQAVSDNYKRLVYDTVSGVYDETNDTKTVRVLREELIGQLRASMLRVFGDLILNNIRDPLNEGTFYFQKGNIQSYHFKNLSGGEKAAFDLLLDLHVKRRFYQEAIYCVDELETHLHTRVQGTLLREMVSILPTGSQLWVTTHSLGVIRAAQEMARDHPDSVCLIDFDGVDPDEPREIVPSNLGRVSWEKMMSIALDDLSFRIAPETVIVCEGSMVGNRRKNFDAEIYNRILGSHYPNVTFVSGGNSTQVANTGVSVREAMAHILKKSRLHTLVDRDSRSNEEVKELESAGTIVLPLRNLESFLFADEVIQALVDKTGKPELYEAAIKVKTDAIAESVMRGHPSDDLKSASGKIFTDLVKLLGLQRCGNNVEAFMRDTLAPLVTPSMKTFESLRDAIIGSPNQPSGQTPSPLAAPPT